MKTIWKYELEVAEWQDIKMPRYAEVLCVQAQSETPCIWALVNPEEINEIRTFRTFGTGQVFAMDTLEARKDHKYVGTYQIRNGSFVGHVFEVANI